MPSKEEHSNRENWVIFKTEVDKPYNQWSANSLGNNSKWQLMQQIRQRYKKKVLSETWNPGQEKFN